jgi:hypothetical protein
MRIGDWFQWEKISGEPMEAENVRVTPQARVLAVRAPFGGFVWNRPVSLVVEREGERAQVTIPDVTLMLQVLFGLAVVVFSILFFGQRKGVRQ